METIIDKKERRSRLVREARSLIDRAEQANRDFTADEKRRADELDREITGLHDEIERQERSEQRDRDRAGPLRTPSSDDGETEAFLRGETRSLEVDFHGLRTTRDLEIGTDAAGGHTVPTSFRERLYEHLVESSAIRRANPTVVRTDGGEDLAIPKTTGHSSASIVSEGGTIGEDDPAFDVVTLGSYKYANLTRVTSELLSDTGIDLEGYLARDAGRALGNASGAHFVTGDGASKPTGLLEETTEGVAAAGTTAVTADELIELYHSVIPDYRRNGFWLMNDSSWAAVRSLKDSNDRFLVGDLASGASPQLLGRPVVIEPQMPSMAASATPVAFGDVSAYHIREVGSLRFERSTQAGSAFETDTVLFRAIWRLDGKLVDTSGAVKHLTMAAS